MAGELDLQKGLLTQAPTGSTINNGIVSRPAADVTSTVPVLPTPDLRSVISQTKQPGYIQGFDTNNNYNPVFVPNGQYVPGISATPKQMTTDSLNPASSIKLPPIEQQFNQADATIAGGKASIDSIMQEFTPQVSETQQKAQGVNDLIASLTKDLENKGVDQLSTEQSVGIPELKTQFAEINSLMSTRLAEYNALLSQNKNKPVTMSSIIGSERAILDAKASDIGLLQAQAEGLKGRIQVAQDTANRAVDLKYSTIEARLNTYEAQLKALQPTLNKEEKQQALAQQVLLDQRKQEIADKKEKEKSIQNAMMDYFNAGGTDTKVANAISNAATVEEAQRLAGAQVGSVVAEEMAMKRADFALDSQYKRMQMANIQSEINNRGASAQGYDPAEILAYAQEKVSTGKTPTGVPKGSFGLIDQIAKELPKPMGSLVDINTGVKSSALSATQEDGILALYDITKKVSELAELDKKRVKGLIPAALGKAFGTEGQGNYVDLRDEIIDLLARARTGAALTKDEEAFYKSQLPGRVARVGFVFGRNSQSQIDNFNKKINGTLNTRLQGLGGSIYGYSKTKIGDQEYTVGDIINNGTQSARVNPDGTLTIIQ